MTAQLYRYVWGNWMGRPDAKRATLKGRQCRITAVGNKMSVEIEFEDGQREIVSRRALRRER